MAKLTKEQRGATLCWHCMRHLMWAKGGSVKFRVVVDRAGIEHRVHQSCVRGATEDGDAREVKPAIAA